MSLDILALRDSLGLTPDQHEQFNSLPQEVLENLAKLPPAAKALIGEKWRVADAVGNTNFDPDPEARFKAWRDQDEHEARWKAALAS